MHIGLLLIIFLLLLRDHLLLLKIVWLSWVLHWFCLANHLEWGGKLCSRWVLTWLILIICWSYQVWRLGVVCFDITLLGHSPFWMEISLIYLPGPFLSLACIGVCNHIFVVIVAFSVTLEVLHVLAFWWSSYSHCILWCVCHRCKCEISLIQRKLKGILFLCLHIWFLHLLRSWKQMHLVCCSVAVQHLVHICWCLFVWLVVVFCHSRLRLFSKEHCRSIALTVEMHSLLRVSNPIVKLVPWERWSWQQCLEGMVVDNWLIPGTIVVVFDSVV